MSAFTPGCSASTEGASGRTPAFPRSPACQSKQASRRVKAPVGAGKRRATRVLSGYVWTARCIKVASNQRLKEEVRGRAPVWKEERLARAARRVAPPGRDGGAPRRTRHRGLHASFHSAPGLLRARPSFMAAVHVCFLGEQAGMDTPFRSYQFLGRLDLFVTESEGEGAWRGWSGHPRAESRARRSAVRLHRCSSIRSRGGGIARIECEFIPGSGSFIFVSVVSPSPSLHGAWRLFIHSA